MSAINGPGADRKLPPAQFFVSSQLSYHVVFWVRSPCSINFQNSRFFPS